MVIGLAILLLFYLIAILLAILLLFLIYEIMCILYITKLDGTRQNLTAPKKEKRYFPAIKGFFND